MSEPRKTVVLVIILLGLIAWMVYRDWEARSNLSYLQEPFSDGILIS